MAEEVGEARVEAWKEKGKWAWKNAETAWEAHGHEESVNEHQQEELAGATAA